MSDRVVVMSARPGRIIADVRDHARPATLGAGAAEATPPTTSSIRDVWTKLEEGLSRHDRPNDMWTTPTDLGGADGHPRRVLRVLGAGGQLETSSTRS